MKFSIRKIQKKDDPEIERIIRFVLTEHGLNKPGTAFYDDSLRYMHEFHLGAKSIYFIAENENGMLGGGGVYPSNGLPEDTCELVKVYLLPEARGKGVGTSLIDQCIIFAQEKGYKKMYLETMDELKKAVHLYERQGFRMLQEVLGNTGHFACGIRMIKDL